MVIPNGIDTNYFKPLEQESTTDLTNLCWFGRTHGIIAQGVGALNKAIALARDSDVQFKAYLIGSADKQSTDQFDVIGWVDQPLPYLQNSQIAFGHSRALREAMACGNVGYLLGAGYGGIVTEETIIKNKHLDAFPEYKLPKANPEVIAQDIAWLINNPNLQPELKKQAREIAVKHFNLGQMVHSTITIYRHSLRKRLFLI